MHEPCSRGRGQVCAGLQGREERVMLLEPHPSTVTQEKHELQCKNILLGGGGYFVCIQEQTLGMETEGLYIWSVLFLQTAHPLVLTFIPSASAAGSAVFHPKSHKTLISLISYLHYKDI